MLRPRLDFDEDETAPGVFYWAPLGFDVLDAEPLSSEEPEEDGGVLTPDDVVPA